MLSWAERMELHNRVRCVALNTTGQHPETVSAIIEAIVHEFSDGEQDKAKVREKVNQYLAEMRGQ
jgi:hypothetical protein